VTRRLAELERQERAISTALREEEHREAVETFTALDAAQTAWLDRLATLRDDLRDLVDRRRAVVETHRDHILLHSAADWSGQITFAIHDLWLDGLEQQRSLALPSVGVAPLTALLPSERLVRGILSAGGMHPSYHVELAELRKMSATIQQQIRERRAKRRMEA
jgi:hypothetical protein